MAAPPPHDPHSTRALIQQWIHKRAIHVHAAYKSEPRCPCVCCVYFNLLCVSRFRHAYLICDGFFRLCVCVNACACVFLRVCACVFLRVRACVCMFLRVRVCACVRAAAVGHEHCGPRWAECRASATLNVRVRVEPSPPVSLRGAPAPSGWRRYSCSRLSRCADVPRAAGQAPPSCRRCPWRSGRRRRRTPS